MPPLACLHPSKFSSCSWHKKPTLVELETESSTAYCGKESKTVPLILEFYKGSSGVSVIDFLLVMIFIS